LEAVCWLTAASKAEPPHPVCEMKLRLGIWVEQFTASRMRHPFIDVFSALVVARLSQKLKLVFEHHHHGFMIESEDTHPSIDVFHSLAIDLMRALIAS